jgi:hypothetical protein
MSPIMDSHPRILSGAEYDDIIRDTLRASGIEGTAAAAIIRDRFPMVGFDILTECAGRGLALTLQDFGDYLRTLVPAAFQHEDTLDPIETVVGPANIELLIAWALEQNRGTFTKSSTVVARLRAARALKQLDQIGQEPAAAPARAEPGLIETATVLAGLQSEKRENRETAVELIKYNLDAGVIRVEQAARTAIAGYLDPAMSGDPVAIDQLQSLITTGRPALLTGAGGAEPSLPEALAALRCDDPRTRGRAAMTLAVNLGAGMSQSEHREDIDALLIPQLDELLRRAVNGDAAACDELERRVTATRPDARAQEAALVSNNAPLFAAMRSASPDERFRAAFALWEALHRGMERTEFPEDLPLLDINLAPAFGAAIAGATGAVDELEALISDHPPEPPEPRPEHADRIEETA